MDRRIPFPRLPSPPKEYHNRYMEDLVRALEDMFTTLRNPGEGRNATLVLTHLPTSADDKEDGTLWNSSGVVLVVGGSPPADGYVLQWNASQGKAVWVDPSTL
jgi:hypothetical protein